jgi:osmoprotectant transport system substrate-binding protein
VTRRVRTIMAGGAGSLLILGSIAAGAVGAGSGTTLTIADKGFPESQIVAQAYAKALQAQGYDVSVKTLASTQIADAAIRKGDIDMYPEYTGTALLTVLKGKPSTNGAKVFSTVKAGYAKRSLVALNQSPYNNDNEVACTRAAVRKYRLSTLSSLKKPSPQITYAANPEHLTRADGLPLLVNRYGITFKSVESVDINLRYKPIEQKKAQCVYAFGTDPQISQLNLTVLRDDKKIFQGTPYQSFPVVSKAYFDSAPPSFAQTVNRVSALLNGKTMTSLIAKVQFDKEDPDQVAEDFLKQKGVISS